MKKDDTPLFYQPLLLCGKNWNPPFLENSENFNDACTLPFYFTVLIASINMKGLNITYREKTHVHTVGNSSNP